MTVNQYHQKDHQKIPGEIRNVSCSCHDPLYIGYGEDHSCNAHESVCDQKYTDEIEPLYGNLDCPTQILWGEEDRWIPIATGERLAKLTTNGQLIRVPSAGHLVQEDAPEAIVAAVLQR